MPNETIGETIKIETINHPQRTDSPDYLKSRKWLMSQAGGCFVCDGPVDMSHPELSPAVSEGMEDHHGGGIFHKGVLVGFNLFGMEWSLGWSADPAKVAAHVRNLNAMLNHLGETPYNTPIQDTAGVMAFVDSPYNASIKLCALPKTEVLMSDGSKKPIADIVIGDEVIGGDGLPRMVTGVASRDYDGDVVQIANGPTLTPDHEVITSKGWSPIKSLSALDNIYRVFPTLQNFGRLDFRDTKIKFGEVHNDISESSQLSIPDNVVSDPWPVPIHSCGFNDNAVVGQDSISNITPNWYLEFIPNVRSNQSICQQLFQSGRVSPLCSTLPIIVVKPETLSATIGRSSSSRVKGLTASATRSHSAFSRIAIKYQKTLNIGLRLLGTQLGTCLEVICMAWRNKEVFSTNDTRLYNSTSNWGSSLASRRPVRNACRNFNHWNVSGCAFIRTSTITISRTGDNYELCPTRNTFLDNSLFYSLHTRRSSIRQIRKRETAIIGTSSILRQTRCNQKRVTTDNTNSLNPTLQPFCFGRWCSINDIHTYHYTGKVHDITIHSAESFVADGIVIHNCRPHHIGHCTQHTPDVNGHEAVGIHEVPFPIWLMQVHNDWSKWNPFGNSTGTLVVAPHPDGSNRAVVMHVHAEHPEDHSVGKVLESDHPDTIAAITGVKVI